MNFKNYKDQNKYFKIYDYKKYKTPTLLYIEADR